MIIKCNLPHFKSSLPYWCPRLFQKNIHPWEEHRITEGVFPIPQIMRSHVFNNIKYAKLLNRLIIKASDPAIRRSIDLTFRQTLTSVQIDLNLDLIIDLHMTSRRITKLTLTLNLALPGLSRVPVQLRKVSAQRREVVTRGGVGWVLNLRISSS